MITYLKVRNLAIVEEFAIEPGAGLNVLTGETGAGKSLLIDSLEFLRGARGSTEMIRGGAEKMSAEAVFHLPEIAAGPLEARGVEVEASGELIVKREISAGGRGRVLINGSPLSVRELGAAMDAMLDIHGQNESLARVAGHSHRELLDEFGDHESLLDTTRALYAEWKRLADDLEEMQAAQRDRTLRLDLLKYQVDEISGAALDPDEEEVLRAEKNILSHAREVIAATSGAFVILDDDESAATVQLARALHLLQPLSRDIAEIRAASEELQEVLYKLQDVSRTLSSLSENVRHDPTRLEDVEDRLVLIDRLKKKYGATIAEVLDRCSAMSDEYDRLADYEANLDKLQRAEAAGFEAYRRAAEELSKARRKAARKFEAAIHAELQDLAMEGTTVKIAVTAVASPTATETDRSGGPDGFDRVEFLIAPNRGEEPKPMQRIASGGELSRIQLAIAAALFKQSHRGSTATLVFDEIDAGIGGRVAEVVGRKLQELAANNQVICVTHLPQIASFGTTHFHVWKEDEAGRTRARIRRLDGDEERIGELARMLGGESIPESAVLHARELLGLSRARPARARR